MVSQAFSRILRMNPDLGWQTSCVRPHPGKYRPNLERFRPSYPRCSVGSLSLPMGHRRRNHRDGFRLRKPSQLIKRGRRRMLPMHPRHQLPNVPEKSTQNNRGPSIAGSVYTRRSGKPGTRVYPRTRIYSGPGSARRGCTWDLGPRYTRGQRAHSKRKGPVSRKSFAGFWP